MLKSIVPQTMQVEPDAWFIYNDGLVCSPDILIHDNEFGFIIVVEVKYTYTPAAIEKLIGLYCPVVSRALRVPTKPLVLVKNLIPDCPPARLSISSALLSPVPLVQWIGT